MFWINAPSMSWWVVLINWSQSEWRVVMGWPSVLDSCPHDLLSPMSPILAQVTKSRISDLARTLLPIIQISCLMYANEFSWCHQEILLCENSEWSVMSWLHRSNVAGCWVIFQLSFVNLTSYLDDSFSVYTVNQLSWWTRGIWNILALGVQDGNELAEFPWFRRFFLCWSDQLWVSSRLNFALNWLQANIT